MTSPEIPDSWLIALEETIARLETEPEAGERLIMLSLILDSLRERTYKAILEHVGPGGY